MFRTLLTVVLIGFCNLLHAEVYLCKLADGKSVAQDTPCPQDAKTQYKNTVPPNPRNAMVDDYLKEQRTLNVNGNDLGPTKAMKEELEWLLDYRAYRDMQSGNPYYRRQGMMRLAPERLRIEEERERQVAVQLQAERQRQAEEWARIQAVAVRESSIDYQDHLRLYSPIRTGARARAHASSHGVAYRPHRQEQKLQGRFKPSPRFQAERSVAERGRFLPSRG